MSSFFNCIAYSDADITIRLDDNVVFLALKAKENDTEVHLSFNPFQTRTLAQNLSLALSQIDFTDLKAENYFGDLSVKIEGDALHKIHSDNNLYDNELMYVKDEDSIAIPF